MSEPNPPSTTAPIVGGRTLAWLGGLLLFGLLIQTILAHLDRGQVETLESFSEMTAVGDRVYYTLPSPLPDPPDVVARVKGEALVPVSYAKVDPRDSSMRPVARDPVTKLTIYETRETQHEAGGEKFYFVKTASHEYLKLRVAK